MLEKITVSLQELGIIVAVHSAFIKDEFAVDILAVYHVAVAVKLISMALCTESNEYRQRAEVIYMVVDGADAERAEVGNNHGAVEGAGFKYRIGQEAKIVQRPDDSQRGAEKEAGQLTQSLGNILGVVVVLAGLDFLNLLVELTVDIKNGVRGQEVHLYRGLGGVEGDALFDSHNNVNSLAGVDAAAGNKAVDTGHHADTSDIGSDKEMQNTDALIALYPQLAQAAVKLGDFKALFIEILAVNALGHYVGYELVERSDGAKQTPVFAVAKATLGSVHNTSSGIV